MNSCLNIPLALISAIGLTAVTLSPAVAVADARSFATPAEAIDAVEAALVARDADGLLEVFGSETKDIIFTGEEAEDKRIWAVFLSDYRSRNKIVTSDEEQTATLLIGRDLWPFPVPLVQDDAGSWSFDAESAREEILNRRIGRNELNVINLMHLYVAAQQNYRQTDHNNDGVLSFADGILSDDGERNGMYWPSADGGPESPVGEYLARAAATGYNFEDKHVEPEPFQGYYYHMLDQQGESAPGGAYSYRTGGQMLGGHALLAYPASPGESGIMTFMVSEAGVIYEADLGEDTLEKAAAIESFDPGEGWTPVDE